MNPVCGHDSDETRLDSVNLADKQGIITETSIAKLPSREYAVRASGNYIGTMPLPFGRSPFFVYKGGVLVSVRTALSCPVFWHTPLSGAGALLRAHSVRGSGVPKAERFCAFPVVSVCDSRYPVLCGSADCRVPPAFLAGTRRQFRSRGEAGEAMLPWRVALVVLPAGSPSSDEATACGALRQAWFPRASGYPSATPADGLHGVGKY